MEFNVLFSICKVIFLAIAREYLLRHSVLIVLIGWHGLLCQRLLKDRGKY